MELHNTAIKKSASELFEINALDAPLSTINDTIAPVVVVEPYIEIMRTLNDYSGDLTTIYQTPTDKDFYLTNCSINIDTAFSGTNKAKITFVTKDGITQTLQIYALASVIGIDTLAATNNETWVFPLRGVLLQKNSAIQVQGSGSDHDFMIAGYLGSDRS